MSATPEMPQAATPSPTIQRLLDLSAVHPQWRPLLAPALAQVDGAYLTELLTDPDWLPGPGRLLAAFQRDLSHCRFILFGESPYPRRESANGIAFQDAAVTRLWSDTGLSKAVNRATSLRNIIKAALLAERRLEPDADGRIPQAAIATLDRSSLIDTLDELFDNLHQRGFLLFNATPVLHPARKPAREARYWDPFCADLLRRIDASSVANPTLVLWGRIVNTIGNSDIGRHFPRMSSEHPYNVSFIHNVAMQDLLAELELLRRPD